MIFISLDGHLILFWRLIEQGVDIENVAWLFGERLNWNEFLDFYVGTKNGSESSGNEENFVPCHIFNDFVWQ